MGYCRDPVGPELHHLFARVLALVGLLEDVLLLVRVIELAGRGIERDRDLLAGLESRLRDGFQHNLNRFGIRLHRRRKSAFIANRGVVAALLQHALQHVEGLDAPAQRFAERRSAHRHHHELLEIDIAVGMRAAIEDVHHRRGQQAGGESAEILVKLDAQVVGHGARRRHGDREDRVRPELALVGGAVEFAHGGVESRAGRWRPCLRVRER